MQISSSTTIPGSIPNKWRGLGPGMARDRAQWRGCVHGTRPTPAIRGSLIAGVGSKINFIKFNTCDTKVMRCSDRDRQPQASGKYPCEICKKGVKSNSVECTGCKKWIHKKYSGIKGALKEGSNYRCTVC